MPEATIRMGIESLVVEGWQLKKHYDAFCQVLGSGINIHLQVGYRHQWSNKATLMVHTSSVAVVFQKITSVMMLQSRLKPQNM